MPLNPCDGKYGKSLDVKITNACNGHCSFCIEKGGYKGSGATVEQLIKITNQFTDYENVLILGGEPFLYPDLKKYVSGLSGKKVWITTNGSVLNKDVVNWPNLQGINVSVHHFVPEINKQIVGVKLDVGELYDWIKAIKEKVPVRINCNLIKGKIDSKIKVISMVAWADTIGASSIRFAELQNAEDLFVSANNCFDFNESDPYENGCEKELMIDKFPVTVRLTCGFVNKLKKKPKRSRRGGSLTKVLYADGKVGTWTDDLNCHGYNQVQYPKCH